MLPDKPLPQLWIDPFSDESLADPYAHHDLLRGAGPVIGWNATVFTVLPGTRRSALR
jgi:hypothetical protein